MPQTETKLSTRQAAVREMIVQRVFEICSVYGAECCVVRRYGDHPREVHMTIDTGRLRCTFTINSMVQQENIFVMPWVSEFQMSTAFGPEVNPHHRRKVTKVFYTISDLILDIDRMLSLDKDGRHYMRDNGKV